MHTIAKSLDAGIQTDVIYLNMAKAFDKFPHEKLLYKLEMVGVRGQLLAWFRSYLTIGVTGLSSMGMLLTGDMFHLVSLRVQLLVLFFFLFLLMILLLTSVLIQISPFMQMMQNALENC